ncbi:MAG: hypothetical protein WCK78_11090 [Paludibacter sp.]
MARIAGITIEKDLRGHARYARIDLRKYGEDLRNFFQEKGVSIDEVKFTTKMKRSIKEAKTGQTKEGNINDFWK